MVNRTIMGTVTRINPILDRPARTLLAEARQAPLVQFDTAETATINPRNPRSVVFLKLLEETRRFMVPVYVEIDDATNAIINLLLPIVTRVRQISAQPSGDLGIELEISHAKHILRRGHERFAELSALLQEAQVNGTHSIVVENDQHEIIEVRAASHPPAGWVSPQGVPLPEPRNVPIKIVSPQRARELFDMLSAETCDVEIIPPRPCIPFLYPDNGCWARAHHMARLMIEAGEQPRKAVNWPSPGRYLIPILRLSDRRVPNLVARWT